MRCSFVIGLFLIGNGGRDAGASVTELSAVYDGFYHRPNFVIGCSEPGLDVCEEEVIGWLQCPSEGVRCHFAGKRVQEVAAVSTGLPPWSNLRSSPIGPNPSKTSP